MDPIVAAALKKWPNVPHCYGWLALDVRGDWYMRDDRIRAAGRFPQVKGSRIGHDKLLAFIGRNYAADDRGCWYFQNGPQRVYVELEAAPWVWRLHEAGGRCLVYTHTVQPARAKQPWLDEVGHVYLEADSGFGLVHTQDTGIAADAIERGEWPQPMTLPADELPARFGFVRVPQPA